MKKIFIPILVLLALYSATGRAHAIWGTYVYTMTYTVSANQPPNATCSPDQAITLPTTTASITGNATDSDGTITQSTWAFQSGPFTASVVTPTANTVPHTTTVTNMTRAGTYVFTYTATDNDGLTGTCTSRIIVDAAVPAPDLIAGTTTPQNATAGTALRFSATITNQGTDTTGIGFYNLFQIASDASGTGAQTITPVLSTGPLSAGTSTTIQSAPYTFSATGSPYTRYVRACADKRNAANPPPGDIDENPSSLPSPNGEDNNCSATWTPVTVTAAGNSGTVTVSLSAAPTTLSTGQSTNLTWTSTNANSCTSADFPTGSATTNTAPGVWMTPASTTTYRITCSNSASSATDQVTVTVLPQCSDTMDNDGDGLIDYGRDPGCTSAVDTDETNSVVLPQCSDTIDNADTEDTLADRADPGCHRDGNSANDASYDPTDNDERDPKKPKFWEF